MTIKRILLCFLSAALLCLTACAAQADADTPALQTDPAMPATTAQILQFYNDALSRAVDGRLSFAKRYRSDDDKFNLSPALSPFKSQMRDYTGVAQKRDGAVVTPQSALREPYERYLQRPSLTAADVVYAACTCICGGLYRIQLHLADGESHVAPGRNEYTSGLDRCGIAAGSAMDTAFDHKSAQNIYEKLRVVAQDVRIDETHSNAVIVAVFRPDGTPVQLNVRFDTAYDIKGICDIGCSAKGTVKIRFVQFGAESPVFPDDDA